MKTFASNHGGRRAGAGRPKGTGKSIVAEDKKRKTIGVRLPQYMVAWLKNHNSPAGRLIEEALRKTFKI